MHPGGILAVAIPAHLTYQTHYPHLQCVSRFGRDKPNPAH